MQPKLINFCKHSFVEDKRYEKKILFWLKIRKIFSNPSSSSFLKRILLTCIGYKIRRIDIRYFKPRIIAICPSIKIHRISSPPEVDKHYHIFKLLQKNAGRINQDLPSSVLALISD